MTPATFLSAPGAFFLELVAEAHARAAALRSLPAWAPGLFVAAGLFVLLAGARRRQPISAAGGAAAGALAGIAAAGLLGLSPSLCAPLGAALLGGGALLAPALFPFAVGALPGAFLGVRFDLVGHPAGGAALGILLLGGFAILAARPLAALFAGLAGAALLGAGLIGLDGRWAPLGEITGRPIVLAAVLLVLAVAGAAAQVGGAWGGGGKKRAGRAEPPSGGATAAQHA